MTSNPSRAVSRRRGSTSRHPVRLALEAANGVWLSLRAAVTPPSTLEPEHARFLGRLLLANACASAVDQFAFAFAPLLAFVLGATPVQIGVLVAAAAALSLMGLALSGEGSQPHGDPWPAMIRARGATYGIYLFLAIAVWQMASPAALWAIIGLWAIRALIVRFGMSASARVVGHTLPVAQRAAYLHAQSDASTLAAIAALPLLGWIIRALGAPNGYVAAFGVAALGGWLTLAPAARARRATTPSPWAGTGQAPEPPTGWWRDRAFVAFCGVGIVWNLSLQMAAPFLNIYLVDGLGASPLGVGVIAAVSLLAAFASAHLVRDITRWSGAWWMLRVTSIIIPFIPWLWIAAQAPWHIAIINGVSGVVWAAHNLAAAHALMQIIPPAAQRLAAHRYQALILATTVAGALLGGLIVASRGYEAVLWISGGGRLLAGLAMWMIPRPTARPSTQAAAA
ncbi:MAG: hypothetical protein Kow0047_11540 [Anaerolineae bacterium]